MENPSANIYFLSISQTPPPGFATFKQKSNFVPKGLFVLHADARQDALQCVQLRGEALRFAQDRTEGSAGLLLYPDEHFASPKEEGPSLWSLGVPEGILKEAKHWADGLLQILCKQNRIEELEMELATKNAIIEMQDQDYQEMIRNLNKKIKELREENQARKEAEETLKKSKKKIQELSFLKHAIIESPGKIIIFALDKNYCYLDFSKAHAAAMKAIWGTEIQIGACMLDYIKNPEDRSRAKRNFDRALSGESWSAIEEYGNANLERKYYENHYAPILDADGKTIGLSVYVIDVSKRMRVQEALAKSEERLYFALSVANDGIWDWHLDTNEVYFDDRYYTMAGYAPQEFPGALEEWKKRVHPEDFGRAAEAVELYLNNKIPKYDVEFRFLKKDGEYMWIRGRGKIVRRDASGKPLRFVGTHADITQRKETEEQLRRIQKMEAIGQLTGGIAHDFNNILGIILGNARLLQNSMQGIPKGQKRLEAITRSAERAADLTRRLLNFSRTQIAEPHTVNLNKIILNIESLMDRALPPTIHIEYHLQEDLWLARIDPGDLEDALLNLILNARDAMPEGGRIVLETFNRKLDSAWCANHPGSEPGEYVLLAVSDSGEGIPKEIQKNIFDPFFTTKATGKGTGLGLAMVFGFVQRSKGFLDFHSKKGIGSSFRIYLPRSEAAKELLPQKKDESRKIPKGKGERILLVDDEKDLLQATHDSLTDLGYKVFACPKAEEALDLLKQEKVDLLFSDVVMPGNRDGYSLANAALHLQPHLKVLLTSGYTSKPRRQKSMYPAFALLEKPYSLMDLAQKIRSVLEDDRILKPIAASELSQKFSEYQKNRQDFETLEKENEALFRLLREALESLGRQEANSLKGLLERLVEQIKLHFEKEELIMQAYSFHDYRNHKQVHSLLLKRFSDMLLQAEEGRISHKEVIIFLLEWWMEHEQNMDRTFFLACQRESQH